ncbi:Avirulence protein (Avh) [Phytophthora palmivora]|uniref:Avirulence protein (Avh) n=1 Tax=Phytophthora palmivora TaxID=4796 RepID=A0A2P4Y572_9STRA|nr:Avirulence protein (Avh) [Phytophthora palmivora]
MHLNPVFALIVIILTAVTSAQLLDPSTSRIQSLTIISENDAVQTRRLRTSEDASEGDIEERRLADVDVAIKEGIHKVRMMTKWKLQFAVWKLLEKDPDKLAIKWGVIRMGGSMWQHPKYDKYLAYADYYGKGPLKYP